EFFRETEPTQIVFTAKDNVVLEMGQGSRLTLLVKGATNRRMEPGMVILQPGASTEVMPPFQGDILGFVLKGRVQIIYGKDIHRARKGECFYCTADREFSLTNPYKGVAEVLWVTSPPNF
ncbi:MAG: cupin domain-containing protein, partial [bacterium]